MMLTLFGGEVRPEHLHDRFTGSLECRESYYNCLFCFYGSATTVIKRNPGNKCTQFQKNLIGNVGEVAI